jgi:2-phosphoglycerate kinase
MVALVPLDELAYMYKSSYKAWNEFNEKVKEYSHNVAGLSMHIDKLTEPVPV